MTPVPPALMTYSPPAAARRLGTPRTSDGEAVSTIARLRRRDQARSGTACPDLLRPGILIDVQWWLLNGGVLDADRKTIERIRPAVEWFTEMHPARYR